MVHATDDPIKVRGRCDLVGTPEESNRFNSGKDTVGVGDFTVVTQNGALALAHIHEITRCSTENDGHSTDCVNRVGVPNSMVGCFHEGQLLVGSENGAAIIPNGDVVARSDGDRVFVDTANDTVVTRTGGDLIGPTKCASRLDLSEGAVGVGHRPVVADNNATTFTDINGIP